MNTVVLALVVLVAQPAVSSDGAKVLPAEQTPSSAPTQPDHADAAEDTAVTAATSAVSGATTHGGAQPSSPKPPAALDQSQNPKPPQPPQKIRPIPGPPGKPLDVLPIIPLTDFWAYGAEVVAAAGIRNLFSIIACFPVLGPITYAIMAPGYIVKGVVYMAENYTTTGPGNRQAALITSYVVEGVNALLQLTGQVVLMTLLSGASVMAIGATQNDASLVRAGQEIATVGLIGVVPLLVLVPVAAVASVGGPFFVVLAYRNFYETSEGERLREKQGEQAPRP